MKIIHKEFPGVFGKKIIPADIYWPDSLSLRPKVYIFFHGCCGTVYDHAPTTYQLLSEQLAKSGAVSIIFENSRNLQKLDFSPEKFDFQEFTKGAFGGKTFQQELNDASTAVSSLLAEVKNLLGDKPFSLTFVGFSLGGLMATLLTTQHALDRLFLFGSAASFQVESDLPILGHGLSQEEQQRIYAAAIRFEQPTTLVHGSLDDTALRPQAEELFRWFTNAVESRYIEWLGVDHRFKQRNLHNDPELIPRITSLLSNSL